MKKYVSYLIIFMMLGSTSCQDDWLNVKRDKQQVVPQSLDELQALLDYTDVININGPYLGEISTTDFSMPDDQWDIDQLTAKNAYIWAQDIYEGEKVLDWELSYERIFYVNSALDGLKNIPDSQEKEYTKGRGLFHRSWNFFQLAQIFSKAYDANTAQEDPGVPIRLEADIGEPVKRPTLQQTYDQIIQDLEESVSLLPDQPLVYTRPGKAAAYALLAKTYLLMGQYDLALVNVDEALILHPGLVDYNMFDTTSTYPLENNEEIIYFNQMAAAPPIYDASYLQIDSDLFEDYKEGDLRKSIFFRNANGSGGFNGSYSGFYFFNGIASDELYLTRAECYARLDQKEKALSDLNTLLSNRYKDGAYSTPITEDAAEVLDLVLEERHKELIFRGIHWMDLRRLNKDSKYATILTREVHGEKYELPPNDPRYVMPIPEIVIELSGIEQNVR